jgi:hypothetical protein
LALRRDGEWHVGDGPEDLDPFLREIGADCYEVHEIRHSVCAGCGGEVFGVMGDPDGGTMRRTCRACGNEHFLADSKEFWSEIGSHIMCCVCEEEGFNLAMGFSLYQDLEGIRSAATAERCVACGKISSFLRFMVRGGDMWLLDSA